MHGKEVYNNMSDRLSSMKDQFGSKALTWTWEKPVKASKFETVDVIYQKDDCEQYINDYLGRFLE